MFEKCISINLMRWIFHKTSSNRAIFLLNWLIVWIFHDLHYNFSIFQLNVHRSIEICKWFHLNPFLSTFKCLFFFLDWIRDLIGISKLFMCSLLSLWPFHTERKLCPFIPLDLLLNSPLLYLMLTFSILFANMRQRNFQYQPLTPCRRWKFFSNSPTTMSAQKRVKSFENNFFMTDAL